MAPNDEIFGSGKPGKLRRNETLAAAIIRDNEAVIRMTVDGYKAVLPLELLSLLPEGITFIQDPDNSPYYNPETREINVGATYDYDYQLFREYTLTHELGHAIHRQQNIVTDVSISSRYLKWLRKTRPGVVNAADEIEARIRQQIKKIQSRDKLVAYALLDNILAAATAGTHGSGHSKVYLLNNFGAERELFAHAVALNSLSAGLPEVHPELSTFIDALKIFGLNVIQGIEP